MKDNTFQSKEFKENLKAFDAAVASGSSIYLEPDQLTDIADYYQTHGRPDRAAEAIDRALAMFPGATDPLAFKARTVLSVDGDTKDALRYAQMIEDKSDLEYCYLLAEIMIAEDNLDQARQYLKDKAKEVDEDDMEDFCLDVAMLFADYDLMEDAQQWLSRCEDTEEEDYQEVMAKIAMSMGDYAESERIVESLIDKDPYCDDYWTLLASAQYLHGDAQACLNSCDFALAIDPENPDALVNKANSLVVLGNYGEAISCYEHYRRLQPRSETADMGIAAALMAQEKYAESLDYWKKAERLCSPISPNLADILRNEALTLATLGRYVEAFQCVDRLDNTSGFSAVDSEVIRGYLYLLAKMPTLAEHCFSKALKQTAPDQMANTQYAVAFCYYDGEYYGEARRLFGMVVRDGHDADHDQAWSYMARCDYELGRKDDFITDLRQALAKRPELTRREMEGIMPGGLADNEYIDYARTQLKFSKKLDA